MEILGPLLNEMQKTGYVLTDIYAAWDADTVVQYEPESGDKVEFVKKLFGV